MGAPLGNTNAAKGKEFADALRRVLARDDWKSLRKITEKLVEEAEAGEQWAVQMVADRMDGKPKQQVEATGEGGGPLVFVWQQAE